MMRLRNSKDRLDAGEFELERSDKSEDVKVETKKEAMKLVLPIYPTLSQAKGIILVLVFFLLAVGLPAGWFGVNQDVKEIFQSDDGAFYIMEVAEEPGFIRSWFRDGGVHVYVRRVDGEDVSWYTYPDSRSLWFGATYEDMFKGWAVEQAVQKYKVPVQKKEDENR